MDEEKKNKSSLDCDCGCEDGEECTCDECNSEEVQESENNTEPSE